MRVFGPVRFLLTATAAVALAAAMPAASASPAVPAAWHIAFSVSGSSQPIFTSVTATSATNAWAFDSLGSKPPGAYQLSGATWKSRAFPAKAGDSVIAAAASSAGNVWAFTFSGQVLRFNGSSWASVKKFSKSIDSGVVISSTDVWVFGATGAWHYDGHSWTHSTSGGGLVGGSAVSASNVWAYGGTSVAHWNGSTWIKTSVASLLPKKTKLSRPLVAGIDAVSASNVYAIGSGGRQDEGGPPVVLHYNGHVWSRLTEDKNLGGPVTIIPDGTGGFWIPLDSAGSAGMAHYAHGALSKVTLPIRAQQLTLSGAAVGEHSTAALAVGFRHTSTTEAAVILRYGT